jgi:hypothetical protein
LWERPYLSPEFLTKASPAVVAAFKEVLQDSDSDKEPEYSYVALEEIAPERIAENGLSQIEPFVARLVEPKSMRSSLLIFTLDGRCGLSLSWSEGEFSIGFVIVEWRSEPETEKAIRDFFRERKMAPTEDHLVGNGGVPDATRMFEFPVKGNAKAVSTLCRQVLQEVYDVCEQEGLDFTLLEFDPEEFGGED